MTYSSRNQHNAINQRGKASKEWLKLRAEWIKLNPPGHQDEYLCGICGQWVHKDGMELDHIVPRSGNPGERLSIDNLQPTHSYCNQQKGSKRWKPKISKAEYDLRKKLDL